MNLETLSRYRLYFTAIISIAVWALLIWQYFHKGIPSHHLLANPDLPSVSNAWGALLIPLFTAYLTYRIQKSVSDKNSVDTTRLKKALWAFGVAALYAVSIALSFSFGYSEVSNFLFMALLALALIFPLYRPYYYLGFVLGLTYFFGAVLPVFIGGIIVLLSVIASVTVSFIGSKLKKSAT